MKHIEVVERIEKETREYVTEKFEIVRKAVVKPVTLTRDVPVFKPEYSTVMVDANGQEISKNGRGDPDNAFKTQFPVLECDKSQTKKYSEQASMPFMKEKPAMSAEERERITKAKRDAKFANTARPVRNNGPVAAETPMRPKSTDKG
jgi:hypothetical protein